MDLERLKRYGTTALVVTALVSVMVGVRSCYIADAWEQRVMDVQSFADSALSRADSLEAVATARTAEATILETKAQRLERSADSIAEAIRFDYPDTERRMVETRLSTPRDLASHPAITQRDALIDDLYKETQSWEEAYGILGAANDTLRASNQALRLSGDALRAALWTATAAADSLNAVLDERPGGSRWWLPKLGVGPSIGIAADGTAYTGVGVNLSWSLPIG